MSREAMQMALEALDLLAKWENPFTKWQVRKPKDGGPIVTIYPHKVATDAAIALRQALVDADDTSENHVDETVKSEHEPVAWANSFDLQNFDMKVRTCPDLHHTVPLYTALPKRTWVGLTDEEIHGIDGYEEDRKIYRFARAIEEKLREKNKW